MRATYGRNLMAQRFLEMQKIESFVPMRKRTVKVGSRIKTDLIPVVRDLIFVLGVRDEVQEAKSKIPYLHYITRPQEGRNTPVEVPLEQMQQFMAVCDTYNENLTYLSPGEINIKKGTPIKIVGGEFDGIEGTFVKVKNSRKKRVVVMIQGLTAVMIAEIEDGYLQVLE